MKRKPRARLERRANADMTHPERKQQVAGPNRLGPVEPVQARCSRRPAYRVHMTDFELLKVLGTGAYGKVFLVRKLTGHDANKLYAMKVLRKEKVAQKTKTLDHTKTERKVLEAIRNQPFLVTMHYAFQTKSKLHLILDYVNGGELFTHLYQRDHFSEQHVKIYIGELILALEKLHKVSTRGASEYFFPNETLVATSPSQRNQLTLTQRNSKLLRTYAIIFCHSASLPEWQVSQYACVCVCWYRWQPANAKCAVCAHTHENRWKADFGKTAANLAI